MSLLLGLEPFKSLVWVVGGWWWWWWVVVVKRHFRVPLWSKPWTWSLKLGPSWTKICDGNGVQVLRIWCSSICGDRWSTGRYFPRDQRQIGWQNVGDLEQTFWPHQPQLLSNNCGDERLLHLVLSFLGVKASYGSTNSLCVCLYLVFVKSHPLYLVAYFTTVQGGIMK